MVNRAVKYKYLDYANLPESEGKRYELIEGELYMVPSPGPNHQNVVFALSRALHAFIEERRLGKVMIAPLDVVLSDEDVLQPDIMFVSAQRLSIITDRDIKGPPDLVVEVLSPATAGRDRTIKRAMYLRFGVREYWIVDPAARTVEVLLAGALEFETVRVYSEGTAAASPTIDGLRVEVSSIFE